MRKILGVLALSSSLAATGCASFKTIAQATADKSKVEDEIEITSSDSDGHSSGKGQFPHWATMKKPPARVALVALYVESPPVKSGSTSNVLTEAGTKKIANNLKNKSVAAMKANFKAQGMELLTPEEFLTDATKKEFFNDFELKVEGAASALNGILGMGDNITVQQTGLFAGSAPADGYKSFEKFHALYKFASVSNSVGYDLAKGIGVDAVLVMVTEVPSDGDHAYLKETNLYMFGPNPIKLADDDLGGFTDGRKGHLYAAAATDKSYFKNVLVTPPDDDGIDGINDEKNYAGYDVIADVMSKKIAVYVHDKATGK